MSVYVDDMGIRATVGRLRARWSHLGADSPEELHEFAAKIGLRREWAQDENGFLHYDVTEGKRQQAIAAGANAVGPREFVRLLRRSERRG